MMPWLRKFDEAPLRKDDAQVMATVTRGNISVSGQGVYGNTDYHESPFGVLDDRHVLSSVDVSYALDRARERVCGLQLRAVATNPMARASVASHACGLTPWHPERTRRSLPPPTPGDRIRATQLGRPLARQHPGPAWGWTSQPHSRSG